MITSFITVLSVLIMMICLTVFPNPQTDPLPELESQEIVNDFEKELQKDQEIREGFESEPAQAPPGWGLYQTSYNNLATYPNCSPVFYEKRIYRKPYRWPFTFKSSYPIEHQSNLDPLF